MGGWWPPSAYHSNGRVSTSRTREPRRRNQPTGMCPRFRKLTAQRLLRLDHVQLCRSSSVDQYDPHGTSPYESHHIRSCRCFIQDLFRQLDPSVNLIFSLPLLSIVVLTTGDRKHATFVDGGIAEFLLVQTMTHDDFAASEDKLEPFLQSELDKESDQEDGDVEMADNQAQVDVCDNDEASDSEEGLSVGYPSVEAPHNALVFRRRGSSRYAQPDVPVAMTETELSDISSRPSLASLEIPERAHILMSSPSLTYVDVPVVCIAEAEAMPFVMSKLLHQRQIWGVTDPVVGFIITSDGLTVQLAMGWIDESGTEVRSCILPTQSYILRV